MYPDRYTYINPIAGYYRDVPHDTITGSFVTGSYISASLEIGKRYRVVADQHCNIRLEASSSGSAETDFLLPQNEIDSFITHLNYHYLFVMGISAPGTIFVTKLT